MFLYKIKVIDVLRDAARAPQPPTNQPTESEEKAILESGLFLTLGSGTSIARNENLGPLLNTNKPLISGKYGLRNHF